MRASETICMQKIEIRSAAGATQCVCKKLKAGDGETVKSYVRACLACIEGMCPCMSTETPFSQQPAHRRGPRPSVDNRKAFCERHPRMPMAHRVSPKHRYVASPACLPGNPSTSTTFCSQPASASQIHMTRCSSMIWTLSGILGASNVACPCLERQPLQA